MTKPIKWKFKEGAEKQGSSNDFWYDMTDGGYINPEEVLADKDQLAKLLDALNVVKSFEEALDNANLREEFL